MKTVLMLKRQGLFMLVAEKELPCGYIQESVRLFRCEREALAAMEEAEA